MKTKKITNAGKAVIFFLVLIIAGAGVYFSGALDSLTKGDKTPAANGTTITNTVNQPTQDVTPDVAGAAGNTIDLSVSEKVSWKPILDANGGLTTQPGSIYDKLGIKVNIKLENNPDVSSKDFIQNSSNALGYTVNGYAALYKTFKDNNVDTLMPYIVDSSVGGDGIIVRGNINSVADFAGKKIGVPKFSSDQAMVVWLMQQYDLTPEQFNQIKANLVVYPSVKKVAEAFFKGEVDVAGVRQPFLTQARNTEGTKVIFTTKSAKNIIANGIVFRKDFVDANPEVVTKFIDGAFQAIGTPGFDNVRVQPAFKDTKDEDFNQMLTESHFNNYTDNTKLLGGTSQQLFEDMNKVWELTGEGVVHGSSTQALTNKFVSALSGKYTLEAETVTKIDEASKQKAQSQNNDTALLKKTASINFKPSSANFLNPDEAAKALEDFVKIANFLDGAVIQIEGNVADLPPKNTEASQKLSFARAKTIAKYLQEHGVDETRFIIVGNGISNQIAPNDTPENQAKNRRTDVMFKIIE